MLLSHSDHHNCWVGAKKYLRMNSCSAFSYGDIYPITSIAHFISMLASLLSLMMVSIVLSAIYAQYIAIREVYQIQLASPENVRYLLDDRHGLSEEMDGVRDVTVEIKERLKYLNIRRR